MLKRSLFILSVCLLIPAASGAAETPAPSSPDYLPGQVLVRVEEGVSPAQVREIAGIVGAKVERRVASWGVYLLSFDQAKPVSEVVERLQGQPGVRYAEPNAKIQVNGVGNDPGTVTAAAASSVVVAIIDTGLNPLPFSGSIYTNTREIAGDGIDNDGNGYVDDVHGWDFYEWDNDPRGSAGDGAHGTMVAGQVLKGAQGAGVSFLSCQVGPGPWLSLDAIVEAIGYAVDQGARIINMSFGASFPYQVLTEAIQQAAQRGVLLVAAAGNSGSMLPSYPAGYSKEVVSVAASNNAGQKTWWSNYGSTVDFTAPGENVTTTNWDGSPVSVSGTSFSAPFVAGVLARILAALPALTPDEAVQRLRGFVKDIYALNHPFYRGKLGYGWVDNEVARQVAEAFPPDGSGGTQPPPPPDSGLKAKLEAELVVAKQEVARLQGELSAAGEALTAAQQATAAAQQAVRQAGENVNKAWKELISSWNAWYRGFFGSPAQREALRIRRQQAWDNLYKAMAERREAYARLRVAQTEEIKARERRATLAAQLKTAQAKVSELERRLAQLAVPAQRLQGSAHRSEIEQLLQKLQAITSASGPEGLPDGVQEVSDLYLPGSRESRSSN